MNRSPWRNCREGESIKTGLLHVHYHPRFGWADASIRQPATSPGAHSYHLTNESEIMDNGVLDKRRATHPLRLRPCSRSYKENRHFHGMPHLLDGLAENHILEKAMAVGGHGDQIYLALS